MNEFIFLILGFAIGSAATFFIHKLNKPVDKIQLDGSAMHDGLYYYSIIIDGSIKQTKTMAVIH